MVSWPPSCGLKTNNLSKTTMAEISKSTTYREEYESQITETIQDDSIWMRLRYAWDIVRGKKSTLVIVVDDIYRVEGKQMPNYASRLLLYTRTPMDALAIYMAAYLNNKQLYPYIQQKVYGLPATPSDETTDSPTSA